MTSSAAFRVELSLPGEERDVRLQQMRELTAAESSEQREAAGERADVGPPGC